MSKNFFENIPVKIGEELDVYISDLAYGGDSIAKYKNFTIFIPYGVPGNKEKIKILEIKKSFARGIILNTITKSKIYKKPECKIFGLCGGCDWMSILYSEQIKYKRKILEYMLKNIGKINNIKIGEFIIYKNPFYYRNRVQYKVLKQKDKIELGFFKARSHDAVSLEHCFIIHNEINKIAKILKDYLNEYKNEISLYDEKIKKGYLRHICLRINSESKILLTFVVFENKVYPFIEKITQKLKNEKNLNSIVLNINMEPGNKIFGEKEKVLYGNGIIEEKIRGIKFYIDSASFFQINNHMLENMLNFIEYNLKTEPVIDLYGGIGALSLPLYKKFKKIFIVEIERKSTEILKKIIKENNINNIDIINTKAENVIDRIIKQTRIKQLIIDPPRKGLHPKVLSRIKNSSFENIVYISCNPASFSRDIFELKEKYEIKKIIPIDQFAQTYHLEVMAFLKKLKLK